ncbi:hypothetical protein ACHAW5_009592 [Stephanodiscus triporus]|uniref:Uncharacterized protein n=1 Tax=Stephanodiscus triporus TaxID=2934178 RepID=A0ABD3MHL0_9STRA
MDQNKTPPGRIQQRFRRKSNRSYYTPIGKENWNPDFIDYPGERCTKSNRSPASSNVSPAGSEEREIDESTPRMESYGRNRSASSHSMRKTYENKITRKMAVRGAMKFSPSNSCFHVWEDEECQ